MSSIELFATHFKESERTKGEELLTSQRMTVRGMRPLERADVTFGGDDRQHVVLKYSKDRSRLIWSCTCRVFQRKENCSHIWASLQKAEQKGFFKSYEQRRDEMASTHSYQVPIGALAEKRLPGLFEKQNSLAGIYEVDYSTRPSVAKREAMFVLETRLNNEHDSWAIKLFSRNSYEDGSLSTWSEFRNLSNYDISDFEPGDHRALREFVKAKNRMYDFSYDYEPFSPDVWISALTEISAIKKLFYFDLEKKIQRLHFDTATVKRPIRVLLDCRSVGSGLSVVGSFVRQGTKIPISKGSLSFGGFALEGNTLYRGNMAGCHKWVDIFKKEQPLEVSGEDVHSFLSTFYEVQDLPEINLPPKFQYKGSSRISKVRLTISRADERNLSAHLEYKYGEEYYSSDEKAVRVLDHDRKIIHVRQLFEEIEARKLLFRMLGREKRSPGGLLLLKENKLPGLIERAFKEKWEVIAYKKHVVQMSEYKLKTSSGIDWFDLKLDMKFTGGQTLGLPDLLRGIKPGRKMITLADGSTGLLSAEVVNQFSKLGLGVTVVNGKVQMSKAQAIFMSSMLQADKNFSGDRKFSTLDKVKRLSKRPASAVPPEEFNGTLRGYQKKALSWLDALTAEEIGCLLADDMGLGKTICILALLSKSLKGQALIVVPKSLVPNWMEEIAEFVPHLKVHAHYGSERHTSRTAIANADIVITTYHTLRADIGFLRKKTFEYFILDEAQWIKNPNSDIHKACRLVAANKKVALTGTPIENSLGDLFAIMNIVTPGLISKSGWEKFAGADDPAVLRTVRAAVGPFILRRRKEEVLKELPKKVVKILNSDLTSSEMREYINLKKHLWKEIKGAIEKNGVGGSSHQILTALLRLRQAACHQGLIKKSREKLPSSKFEMVFDHLDTILEEGHKVLIFSNFRDVLRLLQVELKKRKVGFCHMDGTTSGRQKLVKNFQEDPDKKVFLMTIKTGGVGLNLTAASYVFIMDPWWNPATESQAIDRTHRIGQKSKVTAYKLISKGTVEEKVLALQAKKSSIANAIVDASSTGVLKGISASELEELFS